MGGMIPDPPQVMRLTAVDWQWMLEEVVQHEPEEACGLLAGQDQRVLQVIPVTNVLHSPQQYRLDPLEQLQAFNLIDSRGWELLGIYHSHPTGPSYPSQTDIDQAYYPESIYLIWFKKADVWSCCAYRIDQNDFHEIHLIIES